MTHDPAHHLGVVANPFAINTGNHDVSQAFSIDTLANLLSQHPIDTSRSIKPESKLSIWQPWHLLFAIFRPPAETT